MRVLITISCLLIAVTALSQVATPKTDSLMVDTVKNRFVPTGIRLGTDVISIIKSQRQENFQGWEVNADVDFHRYLLAIDYGTWARTFAGDSANYENDGKYWRAGIDVNFLKNDADRNVFFLGMRYGRATYSESMSLIAEDSVWGLLDRSFENRDLTASWYELTAGLKVKIWKFLWLGYTARMKFGLDHDKGNEMLSHDVPGYGRTDKDTYWGFNYQVMVRIPIRPSVPIQPKVKKKKTTS